jgi:ABC-2 type transport system ATP-binding protein
VADPILELRGVTKSYPGFALRDVSFSLPHGHVCGLIGPNGSGKTTIVKLILGLVRPDSGELRVCGEDPVAGEVAVKRRVGFVHEVPAFYDHLSVGSVASILRPFYDLWDQPLFESLAREFGVPTRKRFGVLSRGTRTKAALALALAHHAELLVLDEPTSGLDPVFRRDLLDCLAAHVAGGHASVLFSTHITGDLERMADYVTFVRDGRLVFSSTREEALDRWVLVRGDPAALDQGVRQLFAGLEIGPHAFTGLTESAPAVRERLAGRDVVVERATLEDIMYYTGRSC